MIDLSKILNDNEKEITEKRFYSFPLFDFDDRKMYMYSDKVKKFVFYL